MKLSEIAEQLEAQVLVGNGLHEIEVTRCGAADLMSDVLARPTDGTLLMTGLTSVQTVRTAKIAGVLAVLFVRGKRPAKEVIDVAQEDGLPLLSTPHSMFVSCGRLHAMGLTGLDGKR